MTSEIDPDSFLQDFHAQYPGATTQIMARSISQGGSSYDLLANEVPVTTQPLTVLDLACGDGYLLSLLQQRKQSNLKLIGVDMSQQELAAARSRLGQEVLLYHERAQQLSLPDASVNIVLCHLALMLMSPLDEVVAELHRILVPGGGFTAVVGSSNQPSSPVLQAFVTTWQEMIQQGGNMLPAIGDPRCHDEAGLRQVFQVASGFEQLTVQEVMVNLDGTPAEVMSFFLNSYNVFALGEKRALFGERMLTALEALQDENGRVPLELSSLKLRCLRSKP